MRISVIPNRGTWIRTILWLVGLAVVFVVFAELFAGSSILWDDSTLLVAGAVLSIALFSALSRARARGIDARRYFLMSVITLLWFVVISEQVFVHYGNTTASASQGNFGVEAYQQVAAWGLAAVVLLIMTFTRPQYLRTIFSGSYKWVSFFAILAVASIPLSPSPKYSLAWAFKLVLTVLLLQACADSMEGDDDLVSFFYVFLAGFFGVIVLRLAHGLAGPEPLFQGGRLNKYASPPGLSTMAGIVVLLSLTLVSLRRRGWLLFMAGFGLLVMLLAGGKAGIVAGVVSTIMFFAMQKRVRYALGVLALFLIVGGVLLATTPLGKYFEDYGRSGEASTMTGRTGLWTAVWPAIMEKPIMGHGYVASRFLSFDLDTDLGWDPPHTHNSFLEPLYNNGIFGLLLVLIMNFIIIRNLLRVIRRPANRAAYYLGIGGFAIYIDLFICGMFNPTFGGEPDICFTMFLALLVASVKLREMTQSELTPS
ncbi:MAG: O-antigen ligase family protein [Candidatus Acidiferrales bacterium]